MVVQISLERALRKIANGDDVKILVPPTNDAEWGDYSPTSLKTLLNGVIFFDDQEPEPVLIPEPEPPKKEKKAPVKDTEESPKRNIDMGKVKALRKAGWSLDKIGEEFGVSGQSVSNWLKKDASTEEE